MTPVIAIMAKELRSYFVSPVVYVVAGVFLLIFGLLAQYLVRGIEILAIQMMQVQGGSINLNDLLFRNLFSAMRTILLFILPILSMRLLAEERKSRTYEFLMTSPIRINEIVGGKFLSAYLVFLGMLSMTLLVPSTLGMFSDFDWKPVLVGYIGLALLGALFLAVGTFCSAITENQIVAALLSYGILLGLWLVGILGAQGQDSVPGYVMSYVSFSEHYDRFVGGLLDTKDLAYFLCGIALMLFLSHRVVDSGRWK